MDSDSSDSTAALKMDGGGSMVLIVDVGDLGGSVPFLSVTVQ